MDLKKNMGRFQVGAKIQGFLHYNYSLKEETVILQQFKSAFFNLVKIILYTAKIIIQLFFVFMGKGITWPEPAFPDKVPGHLMVMGHPAKPVLSKMVETGTSPPLSGSSR